MDWPPLLRIRHSLDTDVPSGGQAGVTPEEMEDWYAAMRKKRELAKGAEIRPVATPIKTNEPTAGCALHNPAQVKIPPDIIDGFDLSNLIDYPFLPSSQAGGDGAPLTTQKPGTMPLQQANKAIIEMSRKAESQAGTQKIRPCENRSAPESGGDVCNSMRPSSGSGVPQTPEEKARARWKAANKEMLELVRKTNDPNRMVKYKNFEKVTCKGEAIKDKARIQPALRATSELDEKASEPNGMKDMKTFAQAERIDQGGIAEKRCPRQDQAEIAKGQKGHGQKPVADQIAPPANPQIHDEQQSSTIQPDERHSRQDPQYRGGYGMNRRQIKIIKWGAVAVCISLLCPPWESGVYGPIFIAPAGLSIDWGRLVLQLAAILLLTGGAVFSAVSSKEKDEQEE